jgi:hypothetical protein
VYEDTLRSPADALDLGAAHLCHELLGRLWVANRPLPAHLGIRDPRADDLPLQVARDRLDLG